MQDWAKKTLNDAHNIPTEIKSIVRQKCQCKLKARKNEQIEKIYDWYLLHPLKI